MATANHVLLRRITTTVATSSVTFDSIPQTGYTDLKLVVSSRQSGSALTASLNMTLNGSSDSFTYKALQGAGSGTPSSFSGSTGYLGQTPAATATANTFGSAEIYIPNYTSGAHKSISSETVDETNATTTYAQMNAVLWSNVAAITSVAILSGNGDFVAGSSFSLYGIADVNTTPKSAPKAVGGDITTDNTYWYHTFKASDTFAPNTSLTVDYLVIGGGGSGTTATSNDGGGGGGGAGGLRCTVGATGGGGSLESKLTLSPFTSYTVTVGAGAAAPGSAGGGITGTSTTFASITSVGGGGGGWDGYNGSAGGSGGGGGSGYKTGGAATPSGQGYAGGNSAQACGGGGGAGQVGQPSTTVEGGNGGNGITTSISGTSTTYAGGGGGARFYNTGGTTSGTGGTGGGGAGNWNANATSGTAYTGSGGGGVSHLGAGTSVGGNGGSGIVIIRYPV